MHQAILPQMRTGWGGLGWTGVREANRKTTLAVARCADIAQLLSLLSLLSLLLWFLP
jgi:hypothetical protein